MGKHHFVFWGAIVGLSCLAFFAVLMTTQSLTQQIPSHGAVDPSASRREGIPGPHYLESKSRDEIGNQAVGANHTRPTPESAEGAVSDSSETNYIAPFFYEIRSESLQSLTPDQQKVISGFASDYIIFYNQWLNTWPKDPAVWNSKVQEIQRDAAAMLGPDAMDAVLR